MSRETNRFVKQLKGSPIRNFDAAISDVKDLIRFTTPGLNGIADTGY